MLLPAHMEMYWYIFVSDDLTVRAALNENIKKKKHFSLETLKQK